MRRTSWLRRLTLPHVLASLILTLSAAHYVFKHGSKPVPQRLVHRKLLVDDSAHASLDDPANKQGERLVIDSIPLGDFADVDSVRIPRGQAFYYTSSESKRLGSFETWRPKELVGRQKQRNRCNWPEYRDAAHTDDVRGSRRAGSDVGDGARSGDRGLRSGDRRGIGAGAGNGGIFVAMITSSATAWQTVPVQLLTMLHEMESFAIYSDAADAIGGVEIVDVLSQTHRSILEHAQDFEAYRILRAIRESHVTTSLDSVAVPGVDKLKKFLVLPALLDAYRNHADHDWFVFVGDSTTLLAHSLLEQLTLYNPTNMVYLGSAVHSAEHTFADLDSGIVLSREALNRAFIKLSEESMNQLVYEEYMDVALDVCCGDLVLALFLKEQLGLELDVELSATNFQGEPLSAVKATARNWCAPVLSFGNQGPREMERVLQYTEVKESPILYSDIYLDFMKPYLSAQTEQNWNNGARDLEYGPAYSLESDAHKSALHCRNECERSQQCLMFRYDPYTRYCGLGVSSVALGQPMIRYDAQPDPQLCEQHNVQCDPRKHDEAMVSGWLIDRIRSMRKSMDCDVLNADPSAEGTEYGALDQVEGWWLRAKSQ